MEQNNNRERESEKDSHLDVMLLFNTSAVTLLCRREMRKDCRLRFKKIHVIFSSITYQRKS